MYTFVDKFVDTLVDTLVDTFVDTLVVYTFVDTFGDALLDSLADAFVDTLGHMRMMRGLPAPRHGARLCRRHMRAAPSTTGWWAPGPMLPRKPSYVTEVPFPLFSGPHVREHQTN